VNIENSWNFNESSLGVDMPVGGRVRKMEARLAALKGSPSKVVQAYRDVTRIMAEPSSSIQDLQGAVEYLLDALKNMQRYPLQADGSE
jgi:hypothetical protein